METNHTFFDIVKHNNKNVNKEQVRNVLVLYEDRQFFIGDSCIRFDQLRLCKHFFPNASVHINLNDEFTAYYKALLLYNPYVDNILTNSWDQLCFEQYDVLICITYHERALLDFLQSRYGAAIVPIAIFSASSFLLRALPDEDVVFPVYKELFEFSLTFSRKKPFELYISTDERKWADNWLAENGVRAGEQLIISLDSSSRRDKLLRMDVYFSMLKYLLRLEHVKVLNFDEKGLGKEEFYKQWLGKELADKMIFSRKLSLREVLCILASSYTSLIIGPCTGLIHCAAAIYNNFVGNALSLSEVPAIITYTGKYYGAKENAERWWGNSPLVDCLFVHLMNGKKTMRLLSSLEEEEKKYLNESLVCTEYSADMIVEFIGQRYQPNRKQLEKDTSGLLR